MRRVELVERIQFATEGGCRRFDGRGVRVRRAEAERVVEQTAVVLLDQCVRVLSLLDLSGQARVQVRGARHSAGAERGEPSVGRRVAGIVGGGGRFDFIFIIERIV